jgi:type I restriction enzyme, S subunit
MIGEGRTRGQVAILDIEASNNQNCAAIWVSKTPIIADYIFYWLWSQYEITRRKGSGNNQPALNKSRVEQMRFALPPMLEQEQIVEEVEQQLSIVSELEAIVEANLKRAERLRQSILKEAFASGLVPQDPNDEPVTILLERIRKERNDSKNGTNNKSHVVSETQPMKIDLALTEQAELWESAVSGE